MSEKLRIAVCDDEFRAATIVTDAVKSEFSKAGEEILCDTYYSPEELLTALESKHYDLIFLDISMPKMDGIELGEQIEKLGSAAEIVFVSSRLDRVFDTFKINPLGFVRKNQFQKDLKEAVERFLSKKNAGSESDLLAHFKDSKGMVSIDVSNVSYIECIRNVQIFHFDGETREHKVYSRMEDLEEELSRFDFTRVHKGYLVNLKYLRHLEPTALTLTDGTELPVSRRRYKEAMDQYLTYAGRHGVSIFGS